MGSTGRTGAAPPPCYGTLVPPRVGLGGSVIWLNPLESLPGRGSVHQRAWNTTSVAALGKCHLMFNLHGGHEMGRRAAIGFLHRGSVDV